MTDQTKTPMQSSPNPKPAFLRRLLQWVPTCREALRLQSEALDHPLPPARRSGLWLHLILCKWCRFYGQQIRWLRRAAQEHPDQLAPPAAHLSPAARERIRQKLRANKE